METLLTGLKRHWFLLGLILAITLAGLFPGAAAWNEGARLTTLIIALVFLGMGVTLPSEILLQGLSKWKIHLLIQAYIFLFIPLWVLFTTAPLKPFLSVEMHIGLLALAVLPTTISTCSVFTLVSRGDTVVALFNAALANLAGVLISPLWLSLLLRGAGRTMPLSVLADIIISLALMMVLPLLVGQVLRLSFRRRAVRLQSKISVISNLMILSIVFFTLARTFTAPELRQGFGTFWLPLAYLILLHPCLILIAVGCARKLKLSGPETIAVMYAAPQKTMAMGVPLLSVYFADDPAVLGIALLPLLFYHSWELFFSGLLKTLPIVKRWGEP
jgi:solute carrier family 10 (sodium/bile acid cotransporter), member 7